MAASQRGGRYPIGGYPIEKKKRFGKDEVVDPVFPLYLNVTLHGETSHKYYGSRTAQRPKRAYAFHPFGINTRPGFPSFDRPDPRFVLWSRQPTSPHAY